MVASIELAVAHAPGVLPRLLLRYLTDSGQLENAGECAGVCRAVLLTDDAQPFSMLEQVSRESPYRYPARDHLDNVAGAAAFLIRRVAPNLVIELHGQPIEDELSDRLSMLLGVIERPRVAVKDSTLHVAELKIADSATTGQDGHLLAELASAQSSNDPELLTRCVRHCAGLGFYDRAFALYERVDQAQLPDEARGALLNAIGTSALSTRNLTVLKRIISELQQLDDWRNEILWRYMTASEALLIPPFDPEMALEHLEHSQRLFDRHAVDASMLDRLLNAFIFNTRGLVELRRDNLEEAAALVHHALKEASPLGDQTRVLIERATFHFNLYQAYGYAGRSKEARFELDAACALEPDFSMYQEEYGIIDMQAGDYGAAVQRFEKALTLAPATAACLQNLAGSLSFAGHPGEAQVVLTRLRNTFPENSSGYLDAVDGYLETNELENCANLIVNTNVASELIITPSRDVPSKLFFRATISKPVTCSRASLKLHHRASTSN